MEDKDLQISLASIESSDDSHSYQNFYAEIPKQEPIKMENSYELKQKNMKKNLG